MGEPRGETGGGGDEQGRSGGGEVAVYDITGKLVSSVAAECQAAGAVCDVAKAPQHRRAGGRPPKAGAPLDVRNGALQPPLLIIVTFTVHCRPPLVASLTA